MKLEDFLVRIVLKLLVMGYSCKYFTLVSCFRKLNIRSSLHFNSNFWLAALFCLKKFSSSFDWGVQWVGSWENRYEREVGGGVLKKYSAQYFAIEKKSKEKGAEGRSTRYTVACQGGRKFGPSLPSSSPPPPHVTSFTKISFLVNKGHSYYYYHSCEFMSNLWWPPPLIIMSH